MIVPARAIESLIRPGVVAVSGGADSVALLLALESAGRVGVVAHFHHHLRGEQADADAEFVARLARRLGLPFERGDGDVAAGGGNAESVARKMRYAWLTSVAFAGGFEWVATGHTADDQAETVLFNLARGTGLRGLRGIAPVRPLAAAGIRLVRPLLEVRRATVRAYLRDCREPHREDETNIDTRLSRARLRATVLPQLEALNPNVVPALGRVAVQATEATAAQAALADALLRACELPRAGRKVICEQACLARLTLPDRCTLVRRVWEREKWPAERLSAQTLQRIAEALTACVAAEDLPGGIQLHIEQGIARLGPAA